MKKLLLLICGVLGFSLAASAQDVVIEGTVTVAGTKEPLPYVTVSEKENDTNGVISDGEGNYSITVPVNSTLVFSFVGYVSKEVKVTPSASRIDVQLAEDAQMLDAVVAVGYGTMRRSDVTGAVSSVSSEMLQKAPVASIDQAMQGRVAGVTINSNSGQPGQAAEVRIRGIGTIGDSSPIYVVDGVITDNISFVNANDIESMEVLKDASSTAIYGSRGANGVIIITTKSGGKEKVNVSFDAYVGIQNRWRTLDLMGPEELARTEVMIGNVRSEMNTLEQQGFNTWLRTYKLGGAAFYPSNLDYSTINTDWQNEVFVKNAVIQNYHVSVDGGTEKAQYSVSAGYFGQEGTIMASFYNRVTLRAVGSYQITKWLKIGTNINYIASKQRGTTNNSEYSGVLSSAIRMAPWDPVYYPEGSVNSAGEDLSGRPAASSNYRNLYNPIGMAIYSHPRNRENRWIGNIYLEIEPIEGLTFRSQVSANLLTTTNRNFSDAYYISDYDKRDKNFLSSDMGRYNDVFYENTLTYARRLGKHNFSVMVGQTTEEYDYYTLGGSGSSIINPTKNNWYLSQTTTDKNYASDGVGRTRRLSFLGRIFYSYDDRYLLTVNFRADGSSKFPENTWGYFPSAALAWRISEESFLRDNAILDNLKLRLGWGQIGNDKIDESSFSQVMATDNPYNLGYVFGPNETPAIGATILTYVNNGGKWEFTEQWNLGVDFGLWGNKLYGTVDAYIRDTKDMLLTVTTPAHVGNRYYPKANVGTVRNQGIELMLGHANNIGDFSYDISGNVSFVKNRLTHLNGGSRFLDTYTNQIYDEGYALFSFWGYKYEGIYRSDEEVEAHQWGVIENGGALTEHAGDARYADLNGDGIIDDNDKTDLGNPFPWLTYGLNLSFNYKGFDLSMFFQGVYGNKIYNALRNVTEGDGTTATLSTTMRDVWTQNNPDGSIPNPSTSSGSTRNKNFSSRLVEDGAYFRMKNIQFGYTLPKHITEKAHMSRVRFYVSASNLFTITGYTGYDPEVGTGVDWGNYPQARTILFGTNINF